MKLKKVISIREALASPDYFGRLLEGDSWAAWRVLLIATVGEELTEDERVVFKALTGRETEPLEPCEEFWAVIGRRGGKTRAMAVLAAYIAALVDHHGVLGPGERGVVPILAASTQQAVQAYNFTAGVFANAPQLKGLVETATADTLRLRNGIDIQIRPASFRTIRGVTAVAVICDEIAYWRSEELANPGQGDPCRTPAEPCHDKRLTVRHLQPLRQEGRALRDLVAPFRTEGRSDHSGGARGEP